MAGVGPAGIVFSLVTFLLSNIALAQESPDEVVPEEPTPDLIGETPEQPPEEIPPEQPTEEVPPEQPAEEVPNEQPTEEIPSEPVEEPLPAPQGDLPQEDMQENTEDPPPEEETQKVEITGTRIKRENTFDHAQIVIVTSEQIEMSGVMNIEQLLTRLPTFAFGGKKTSHPLGKGVVTVDLRHLGPERNLVLVNGHRIIGAGGPSVDMSIIPVSAIDRVEIYHGGASAIYGSGAVVGVINVLLKKDFNGIDARVFGGITTHGDGGEVGASTTMGFSRDRGNIMLNLDWSHRSPVFQRDRSWANPACEDVTWNMDGDISSFCGSVTVPGGNGSYIGYTNPVYQIDYPNGVYFVGPDAQYYPWSNYHYEDWLEDDSGIPYPPYNWGEQQDLSGQSDRIHVTTNGEFRFNNHLTAYMDGLFAYQRHGSRWPGEPINYLPSGPLNVHISNPYVPDQFWTDIINEYGINEAMPYIQMNKRTNDVGARVFENTSTTFRAIVGLKGEISEGYSWDIFGSYSQYRSKNTVTNLINIENFETALDPELCYSNPECVLANVFGEGTMQGDVRDFIGYDGMETVKWHLIDSGAHFTMEPFELPGGNFTAVVGGDFRWILGKNNPTEQTMEAWSMYGFGEYQGNYNTQEAFVEFNAPFVSGVPGASLLELNLNGRYSHFSTFGNVFSFGTGLVYAPIEDVRLRGNWSTSFRAPTIYQLQGPSSFGYVWENDPCSNFMHNAYGEPYLISQCQAAGVPENYMQTSGTLPVQYGSNPNLNSETSRQLNIGTVFAPTFMPERVPLVMTFDWYKIWVFDIVQQLNPGVVLRNCYLVEGLDEYCDYVTRDEATGSITMINATMKNMNELEYVGVDLSANVGFPIYKNFGGGVGFQLSVLRKFTEFNTDEIAAGISSTFASDDHLETINGRSTGVPKIRYLWSFSCGDPIWTASTRIRYISEMNMSDQVETAPYHSVSSVAYWDASGRLRLGDFDIVIGITNILDKVPPYYPGTGYNGNPNVYDFIGRYVFANLGYEFL